MRLSELVILSTSALDLGNTAMWKTGSGNRRPESVSGCSRVVSVWPVSTVDSLETAPMSPAASASVAVWVLAGEHEDLSDSLALAQVGVPNLAVAGEGAAVHAEVGQLADERVGRRLENKRRQRAGAIAIQLDRITRAGDFRFDCAHVCRGRHEVYEGVHKVGRAELGQGVAGEHGHDVT